MSTTGQVAQGRNARLAADVSSRIEIGGGHIDVDIAPTVGPLSQAAILGWVRSGARAVTDYFGRFPVPRVDIKVLPDEDGRVHGGVTYGGRLIRIQIGRDTSQADLDDDWMMTHEMFHLAFPDMGDRHLWMNEGLSTYLEPIARARIGTLAVEQMWRETVAGMPQGLPEPGDRGLDQTHTWGRTYWGGALFWLLADVRIRSETHNAHSVDDAMLAILDAGGDGSQDWSVERVVEVGDRATHTTVIKDLVDQMAPHPVSPDLNALWRDLGIRHFGGRVSFDDSAPLAYVRRAMTISTRRN